MKELGKVEGLGTVTSARDNEKVLGFRINKIIHLAPPINVLQTQFSLMSPDPAPVDINRKGSNFVVDHLEIVKAGRRHR